VSVVVTLRIRCRVVSRLYAVLPSYRSALPASAAPGAAGSVLPWILSTRFASAVPLTSPARVMTTAWLVPEASPLKGTAVLFPAE